MKSGATIIMKEGKEEGGNITRTHLKIEIINGCKEPIVNRSNNNNNNPNLDNIYVHTNTHISNRLFL